MAILETLENRLHVEAVGDDGSLGGSGPEPVDLEEAFGAEHRETVGAGTEYVGRLRDPGERREKLPHEAGVVALAEQRLDLSDQRAEPDRGHREIGTVPGEGQEQRDARFGPGREKVLEVFRGRFLRHGQVPPVPSIER
ncbi:MAG: hypothetical protein IPF66_04710 [Holophagales bacterium]|nr:hypothetical protein [Holophagales bacterium]